MATLILRKPSAGGGSVAPDFWISTTGSNSNDGLTPATAWAITAISNSSKQALYAGKTIGIISGTYGISSLMTTDAQNGARDPAMNINGGPDSAHPTVIVACNSSGIYAPGTVTIQANDNGTLGGQTSSTNAMIGCNDTVTNRGNWRVKGLKFTGFSLWCVHIGSSPGGGARIQNWNFLDCEFTGGSCSTASNGSGVNVAPWIVYSSNNPVGDSNYGFTNCYLHDNAGGGTTDSSHFSACYTWGLAAGGLSTSGTTFTNCTLVNSGGLHGKESNIEGTTVQYCYIDWTAGPNGQNGSCIQGFDGYSAAGLTLTSRFHHNVLLCNYIPLDLQSELGGGGWTTPLEIYNNTVVAPSGIVGAAIVYYENSAGSSLLKFYNNIVYDSGTSLGSYGYALVNADAFSICDYNTYASLGNRWHTVNNGAHDSSTASTKASLAAWRTAIGNKDANSDTTAPTFTNAGPLDLQYTTTSGSAFQTGKTGGTSGGSTVNRGAWDGIVPTIGYRAAA